MINHTNEVGNGLVLTRRCDGLPLAGCRAGLKYTTITSGFSSTCSHYWRASFCIKHNENPTAVSRSIESMLSRTYYSLERFTHVQCCFCGYRGMDGGGSTERLTCSSFLYPKVNFTLPWEMNRRRQKPTHMNTLITSKSLKRSSHVTT